MTIAPPDQFADTEVLETARTQLSNNESARTELRREMAGTELRLALKDLREGVRGMIRVSPLISVVTAALLGAAFVRRRRRRPVRR